MLERLEGSQYLLVFRLSLMAALALPAWTPVQAQQGAVHGGSGGRYFEFRCGPDQILVGLRVSAGVLVDNAQAICARIDAAGGFTGAAPQGPVFGNNRPQDQHVECQAGYAVTQAGIALNDDYPHVGAIQLRCTELANRRDGGTTDLEVRGSGNLEGYQSGLGFVGDTPGGTLGWSFCNDGYATGIRGRAQDHLTALGLLCGPKPTAAAADPGEARTLNKRKKSSVVGKYPGPSTTTSSVPQTQRTLNKRKRPGVSGGASSEENPAPEQSGGLSIFSDSALPAAPADPVGAPQRPPPPSPLINGDYATTLSITDSRCLFKDMRGSWQRSLELTPQPGIIIPLNQFSGFFGGPVNLIVEGLRLSQSTTIPMMFGPAAAPAPATFEGRFSDDGSRFDVRFQAGTNFCRIGGTISGVRP